MPGTVRRRRRAPARAPAVEPRWDAVASTRRGCVAKGLCWHSGRPIIRQFERAMAGPVRLGAVASGVPYDFRGEVLSPSDDYGPRPGQRWTAARKARLLNAVDAGVLSLVDACARYGLSFDEVNEWRDRYYTAGYEGLKATQQRRYRRTEPA